MTSRMIHSWPITTCLDNQLDLCAICLRFPHKALTSRDNSDLLGLAIQRVETRGFLPPLMHVLHRTSFHKRLNLHSVWQCALCEPFYSYATSSFSSTVSLAVPLSTPPIVLLFNSLFIEPHQLLLFTRRS